MTEKCANQIGLSSAAAAPAFRSLVSSSSISPDSLRCSNHTNERKNVSEDSQTSSLTHHRTRHPDFLPRRGKKLPRLPGKTTTQINSNLNHQNNNSWETKQKQQPHSCSPQTPTTTTNGDHSPNIRPFANH